MSSAEVGPERIRVRDVRTLADRWGVLRAYTLDYRRNDGDWQELQREAYDHGDRVVALLCRRPGTVILTRQFRLPALLSGRAGGLLLEAASGRLGRETPAEAARREVLEETGFSVERIRELFCIFMDPTSLLGRTHFFTAEVESDERVAAGGGSKPEGEDIEVVELDLDEAIGMVHSGEIVDAKTIVLLQHVCRNGLFADDRPRMQGKWRTAR